MMERLPLKSKPWTLLFLCNNVVQNQGGRLLQCHPSPAAAPNTANINVFVKGANI